MQLNLAKLFSLTCQYIIIHIIITVPMTTYRNLCHLMTLHADFITCSSTIDMKKKNPNKHTRNKDSLILQLSLAQRLEKGG